MQCANACCKGLTRARRIRRRRTTPSCAMSAPQSHSAAMARGCAGACRASSVCRPPRYLLQPRPRSSLSPARPLCTCSNHAQVQGWPAYKDAACGHCRSRAAAINKYTNMPKVVKGGVYLSSQSWAHSRCSTGTCPIFFCCGSGLCGSPPSTPRLTRGVASQCPSTIQGRREAGPTARAKRESVYFCTANVLTSKQRSATSSTVLRPVASQALYFAYPLRHFCIPFHYS
jgi:hypothetical protein